MLSFFCPKEQKKILRTQKQPNNSKAFSDFELDAYLNMSDGIMQ